MGEANLSAGKKGVRRSPEVEQMLDQFCRQLIESVGATSCSISQWDRARNTVTTQISYANHPELEQPLLIETGEIYNLDEYPTTSKVLLEHEPVIILFDDPLADPAERTFLEESGQKTLLMLPLMVENEVIGLIEVYQRDRARNFSPAEVGRVSSIASQIALIIEGGHLFAEARREARDLASLLKASAAILSSLDLDRVLQSVAEQLTTVLGVESCTISEYDPAAEEVRTWIEYVVTTVTRWQKDRPGTSYRLADYPLTARVLRERIIAAVQADDPTADPNERALLATLGQKSLLMLPMIAYDRVIGLIELTSTTHRHEFASREFTMVQTLTNQAAIVIENARLYSQSQRQLEDLRKASDAQSRLLDMVRTISTPVIPVHDRILILPLIGVVDSERTRQFTERLLEELRQRRASIAVVDITGVPIVDTAVAQALLQTANAARLLGARVILAGIRPEVAQTMVTLGLDMGGLVTKADLQGAVEYALGQLGLRIVRE